MVNDDMTMQGLMGWKSGQSQYQSQLNAIGQSYTTYEFERNRLMAMRAQEEAYRRLQAQMPQNAVPAPVTSNPDERLLVLLTED